MKGQKGLDAGFLAAALLLFACNWLSGQSFSNGKSLHELNRELLHPSGITNSLFSGSLQVNLQQKTLISPALSKPSLPGPVFLPRWSAECLPFFCRIEHDFAQKSAVNFKFRLGSVDYVDWLEGKGNATDYPGQ